MSKRDGTLFSSALFGYKKSDVNAYIKSLDVSYDDQLSLLKSENDRLTDRAKKAESRVAELEKLLRAATESNNCASGSATTEIKSPVKPKPAATSGEKSGASASSSRISSKKRFGILGNGKRK